MISIEEISPFSLKKVHYKKISDLEIDYLLTLKINSRPEAYLSNFLITGISRNYPPAGQILSTDQKKILKFCIKYFDSIVLAKPEIQWHIINLFNRRNWSNVINNGNITLFGKELLHCFGYKNRFRSNQGRGVWLASMLNIVCCPYCNAQHTIVAKTRSDKEKAKFQFDHFNSKDKYPYLSLSLYNLIPSCANCNITKSNKSLSLTENYHPYYNDISLRSRFRIEINPDPRKLTVKQVKTLNLSIKFEAKPNRDPTNMTDKHDQLYDITGIVNRHQDIVEDLLEKAIIYTQNLVKGHLTIKGLFSDEAMYYRYLLGTYYEEHNILKRPLTKMIQDIAIQLELLKR